MIFKTHEVTTAKSKKPRYFYGWNIVGASFLAQLSYVEHFSSILGLFFKPLQSEFGWNRSALAAVQTIARATEAIVAPVVGPLVDRYGPRLLMPIGATVVGLAMLGATQVNAIWEFYLLRGVVAAVGFTFMGSMVTDVAINNWFMHKRGRALAISRTGANLSNIILIPVAVSVLATSGWRTMFVIFAVITWLAVVIPSAILMRRRPEDMGLQPDGIQPSVAGAVNQPRGENLTSEMISVSEPIWSRREVLMTGSFWLLAFSFGVDSMALQGINISLAPFIQDLGYGDVTLTAVMTFRAIIMAVAMLFMGFVAEYAHRVFIRVAPFLIQGVGAFLFLWAEQPVFLWLAVAVYALGIAGLGIIQEVTWANYFGRFSLGLVRSMAFLIASGFGAIGPLAMNAVFDFTGSYQLAFVVIAGLCIAAALLMVIIRRPKAYRYT